MRQDMERISFQLREELERQGLTQQDLAQRASVSQGTVSQIINKKRSLEPHDRVRVTRTLQKLALALGLDKHAFAVTLPRTRADMGSALRDARFRHNLTQRQVASSTGFSLAFVCRLEQGYYQAEQLSPGEIQQLKNLYGPDVLRPFLPHLPGADGPVPAPAQGE